MYFLQCILQAIFLSFLCLFANFLQKHLGMKVLAALGVCSRVIPALTTPISWFQTRTIIEQHVARLHASVHAIVLCFCAHTSTGGMQLESPSLPFSIPSWLQYLSCKGIFCCLKSTGLLYNSPSCTATCMLSVHGGSTTS